MKKMKNLLKNLVFAFGIVFISMLVMTCEPGLGPAVDTQPPTVAVTSPVTKSVLKNAFSMKGTSSDETSLKEVTVVYKNIATSTEYGPYKTSLSNDGSWTVKINEKSNGAFPITDGDYNVTVTATDNASRTSTTSVVYTIDNTAPTVLLTSPSSYSESNCPEYYKKIDIKGEVYDATTLSAVTVYIVNSSGKTLTSMTADGTNTFLASFEQPSQLSNDKVYYYYAVAEDAAGNKNTYCYHRSDIFSLLSTVTTSGETIVFPSINAIGSLDQQTASTLSNKLTTTNLATKKIVNSTSSLTQDKFPCIRYYSEESEKISWSNIERNEISAIGIGTPVFGTILPPTDGSTIDPSKVKVWIVKQENGVYADFSNANSVSVALKTDNNAQCLVNAVSESMNFEISSHPYGDDDNNWTSGLYRVKIQYTTNSDIVGGEVCEFQVSSGVPVLTEKGFSTIAGTTGGVYFRGYMTMNTGKVLSGKARTSDGVANPDTLKYTINDGVENNVTMDSTTGEYSITVPVAADHLNDGEYTYEIIAAASTLSTTISRVVIVDTILPTVTLSNLENGEIITSITDGTFTVRGNAQDTNGISKIEYKLKKGDDNGTWTELSGTKTSFDFTLGSESSPLVENVNYKLSLRITDVAGNVTGNEANEFNFTIDSSDPVATITSPTPVSGTMCYSKEPVTFQGVASDTNTISGNVTASLSYSFDGNTTKLDSGTEINQFNWDSSTGVWLWVMPTNASVGVYDVTLTVKDAAGRTKVVSRSLTIDKTAPEILLTSVSPFVSTGTDGAYKVNGDVNLKFEVNENDKLASVKIKVDASNDSDDYETTIEESQRIQPTVKIDTTKLSGKLSDCISVIAIDRCGNETTYTGASSGLSAYTIDQDTDKPTIEINGGDTTSVITADKNLYATTDSIVIIVKDDDVISSIKYTLDGTETEENPNSASKTINLSLSGKSQGTHTLRIVAKDNGGIETDTGTFSFGIDDAKPELTVKVNGVDINSMNNKYWNAEIVLSGTVKDGYELAENPISIDGTNLTGLTEITPKKEYSWTYTISSPTESGAKSIKQIIGKEKFGKQAVIDFTYTFDLNAPSIGNTVTIDSNGNGKTLTESGVEKTYFNSAKRLVITGTAAESDASYESGLAKVQFAVVSGNGECPALDSSLWELTNGTSAWTANIDMNDKADGDYTVWIMALDYVNNHTESSKKVYAINGEPTITEVNNETSYASSSVNFSGTVGTSLLASVMYQEKIGNGSFSSGTPITGWEDGTWALNKDLTVDNTYYYIITATNKAGTTKSISRTVIRDTTKPTISVFTSSNDAELLKVDETPTKMISGKASDDTSGLSKVYYQVKELVSGTASENKPATNDGNWTDVIGLADWNKTIDFSTDELKDKKLAVYIMAMDTAKNFSDISYKAFTTDSQAPSLEISTATGKLIGSDFIISGTVSGNNATSNSLVLKINNNSDNSNTTFTETAIIPSGDDWAYTVPVATLPTGVTDNDGKFSVIVIAKDNNDRTTEKTYSFTRDKTAPVVSYTNITEDVILMDSEPKIYGTVSDAIGLKGNGTTYKYQKSTDNGSNWSDIGDSKTLSVTAGSVSTSFVLNMKTDLTTNLVDGLWRVVFNSEDQRTDNSGAGNKLTNSSSVKFRIDLAAPEIAFTSPSDNTSYAKKGSNVALSGTSSDTGGIKNVIIKLGDTTLTTITTNTATWSYTIPSTSFDQDTSKSYVVTVIATDNANRSTEVTRNVYYDVDIPVFTITGVSPVVGTKVNGIVTIQGTISDNDVVSTGNYSFNATDDANDKTDVVVGSTLTNWSFTVDTTHVSDSTTLGSVLTFDIKDRAGNSASTDAAITLLNGYTVDQSSDKPVITATNSDITKTDQSDVGYINGTVVNLFDLESNNKLNYQITDDDGVKTVSVKINGTEKTELAKTYSSSMTTQTFQVDFDSITDALTEGRHSVEIIVNDKNYVAGAINNTTTTGSYYIAVDNGAPTLVITSPGTNDWITANPSVTGTVSDTSGNVTSLDVWFSTSSDSSGVNTDPGYIAGSGTKADSWTYTISGISASGYIYAKAVDGVGRPSIQSVVVKYDSTSPTITRDATGPFYVDSNSPSKRLTGTLSDETGGSGVNEVRYEITNSDTHETFTASTGSQAVLSAGTGIWVVNADLTGLTGTQYVHIAGRDIAGNWCTSVATTIKIDADDPLITSDYVNNNVGYKNTGFTLAGSATDSSGIASVTAKIQGSAGNLTGSLSGNSWSFNVPATTANGTLTIIVTATDNCGKTSQKTYTAILDTVVPTLTFTDISNDDNSNTTIETSKNTSIPRVTVSYADATSGVKQLDYSFYYSSNNGTSFDEYKTTDSNATGTFTKSASYSGTVTMKMAETTGSNGAFINTTSDTDGIWYVKMTVTDEAGNTSTVNSPYFYVDQHKPTLTVTSPTDNTLKKQGDALTISGTITDSYNGKPKEVKIAITHPSYNSTELAKFTKTITANETDMTLSGSTYSYSWTLSGTDSPFIYSDNYEVTVTAYDVAGNEYEIIRKLSCDNTAPAITFTRPYTVTVDALGGVTTGTVTNSAIGETNVKANISDFSMAGIYYQIGGNVTITSTGTEGTSGYKINSVTITNPGETNGTITNPVIEGSLESGTLNGAWVKLTDANNGFDITPNTLYYYNNNQTVERLQNTNDNTTIQTLNITVVAVDTAGNINVGVMPIKVDTDTDKPELSILSPKTTIDGVNQVARIGGTTTISGTVTDDNKVHSVYLQVEVVDGNYVNGELTQNSVSGSGGNGSTKFGVDYSTKVTNYQTLSQAIAGSGTTSDYFTKIETSNYGSDKTAWYRANVDSMSTSTTWNLILNIASEFNNKNLQKYYKSSHTYNENDQTELIVRVLAMDTKATDSSVSGDAKIGEISTIHLFIDADAPSITINNSSTFPTEGTYISGTFPYNITFTDDGGITDWYIQASSSASGDSRSTILVSGTGSDRTETISGTIDTATIYSACGNVVSLKIYVEDNNLDSNNNADHKSSYETYKFTIDNTAPEATASSGYYIDTATVIGDVSGKHRESSARGSHLRIMSEQAELSGKVEDESNGSGINYVMLYCTDYSDSTKLYNPGVSGGAETTISTTLSMKDKDGNTVTPYFPVANLASVSRNNNSATTTPYVLIDKAEGLNDNGSNGDADGYDENLKSDGTWVAYIDSTNLPDGLYKIHYVVVDYAGNARYYSDSMLVQNHAPTVTSIVLATDVDSDGTVTATVNGTDDEDQLFDTTAFDNTGFTVKNSKLVIRANVTGGTGTLKYFLKYPTSSGTVTTTSSTDGYSTGVFTITSFPADSASAQNYVVWVEDSVEADLSLSSGDTTFDMIMDNVDDIKPYAQIFELNTIEETSSSANVSRGSLYTNASDEVQGHIETRDYTLYDNETGKPDPDVSGTIILRGEVLDNQRIGSIVLSLNGTDVTIASWIASTHTLDAANGATLISDIGLAGHHVEWSYPWNTNAIAAADVNVTVTVTDGSSNTSTQTTYSGVNNTPRTESNKFASSSWGYNDMTVDVVPYISKVTTKLSSVKKKNPSVYDRTALGHYPVNSTEPIELQGFNLNGAVVKNTTGTTVTTTSTNNTVSIPATSVANLTSGNLLLTVSGVSFSNNINNNDTETNQRHNGDNNEFLTDDVIFDIWKIKNSARSHSGTLTEPSMKIIPAVNDTASATTDSLRFAFTNGAEYFSMAPAKSSATSYQYWEKNYADFNNVAFAYDSQGNSYGITTGLDTYPNNTATLAGRMTFISSRWGKCRTGSMDDNYWGYHKLRLEAIGIMKGAYVQGTQLTDNYIMDTKRFSSPALATAVHGGTGTNAATSVYYAYYDKFQKQIRFRYGTFNTNVPTEEGETHNSNGNFNQFQDQYAMADTNSNSDSYRNNKRAFDAAQSSYSLIAGKDARYSTDTGNIADKYVSIDVIPGTSTATDVVVAVWYDGSDLKYIYKVDPYSDNDADQTHDGTAQYWSKAKTIFTDGGKYCSIKVDANGGIHIAAQDSVDQDLKYAYLSSYNTAYTEATDAVTVDAYAIVGSQAQIDVQLENEKAIPYISYYDSSTQRPKMAYLVARDTMNYKLAGADSSDETFTGNWEITLIPTESEVQDDHMNICLWKTTAGVKRTNVYTATDELLETEGTIYGNGTVNPVVGYATIDGTQGYIETAQMQ